MVYITSDLFGGASSHSCTDSAPSTHWTGPADSPLAAGLGKRKRLDGDEGPNPSYMLHQRSPPSGRGLLRPHTHSTPSFENNRSLLYPVYSTSPIFTPSERRPVKQMKRLSTKPPLVKSASHLMDVDLDLPPSLPKAGTHSHAVTDLRSCHACKSAPKRRKDLENYLDCRRCDGRTCYICARQCFGACGQAVCKKCVVEVGEDGDPWCLDCYAHNINS